MPDIDTGRALDAAAGQASAAHEQAKARARSVVGGRTGALWATILLPAAYTAVLTDRIPWGVALKGGQADDRSSASSGGTPVTAGQRDPNSPGPAMCSLPREPRVRQRGPEHG
jgi:hypothetical protein